MDRLKDGTPIMIQFIHLNALFNRNFGECKPIFDMSQLEEFSDIKLATLKVWFKLNWNKFWLIKGFGRDNAEFLIRSSIYDKICVL